MRQYTAITAVGTPNSRTFARALNILLDTHEDQTNVSASTLMADQDSKFTRSFKKLLKRRNITLKYQISGITKNSYVERQGYEIKKKISSLCRKLKKPWPEVLEPAVQELNKRKIPGTKYTTMEAYEGENYAKILQVLQRRDPYRVLSLYPSIPLSEKEAEKIFEHSLDEKVKVDLTPFNRKLQKTFFKQSEGRLKTWGEGLITGRRLVQTARNTLIAKYCVLFGKKKYWVYPTNLRKLVFE